MSIEKSKYLLASGLILSVAVLNTATREIFHDSEVSDIDKIPNLTNLRKKVEPLVIHMNK